MSLQLSNLENKLVQKVEAAVSTQEESDKKLESIQAYIVNQKLISEEKKKLAAKLSKQQFLTSFSETHATVLKAEVLRFNKQFKEAAKLIKGTKKSIWKAGDTYPDKQKALRGLMPKIDALVNAWNKGNGKATAQAVYSTLNQIIQEKGK
jgi:vacuolar-type H+-ATPase subunit I/STV1